MLDYVTEHESRVTIDSPVIIAFPGPIGQNQEILQAPTVAGSGSSEFDLPRTLASRTGRHVTVLNDVSAAAWRIAQQTRARRFAVVTVSSGIGSKIFDRCHASGVLDQPPYAGEIGHVVVDDGPDAPTCDCSGKGHLGAIASARVSHAEMLFGLNLDALFICTAPGTRGPIEMRCIEARLPFYVEKPVGISTDACQGVARRLEHSPVLNGVGYMNRYRRSIQKAEAILGTTSVIGFSAHWVCKRYGVPWWEIERDSGGPHNEQATHLFDLVRFLIGEVHFVKSIFAGNSRASTALGCEGNIPGTCFYSCDGNGKDIGIRVFAGTGSVVLSGWNFCLTENTTVSAERMKKIFFWSRRKTFWPPFVCAIQLS